MPEARAIQPSNKGKLIGRIVLWSVLGVLLALALFEFYVKQSAVGTYQTWDKQLVDKQEAEEDLFVSDLVSPKGSPKQSEENVGVSNIQRTYVWKGLLRDYTVQMTIRKIPDSITTKQIAPTVEDLRMEGSGGDEE